MSYEENIPEFALKPAKEPEETGDGFDPTPYDRLLYGEEKDTSPSAEDFAEAAYEPSEETVPAENENTEAEAAEPAEEASYDIEPEDPKEQKIGRAHV